MNERSRRPGPRPLRAPLWHTALLAGLFIAVAVTGALVRGPAQALLAPELHKIRAVYLPLLAVEWGLFAYVAAFDRALLRELFAPVRLRRLALDLLVGALAWVALSALDRLVPRSPAASALLPQGHREQLVWIAVSLSAGLCEEIVFRGYLLRQLESITGRAGGAIALQAALFGIAHGYQGLAASAQIALIGAALGLLAHACRSLRPAIACHVIADLATGLLPR